MNKTILFALCIFSLSVSKAQTKEYSFNLQQAVDFAMQNQTKVLNAVLDEQIADSKVKEIRGIGLPQINGSFDLKDFKIIPTQVFPIGAFSFGPKDPSAPKIPEDALASVQMGVNYNATAGLDASQLIFDASYILGLKASNIYRELVHKSTSRTKTETAATVTKAYYMVLVNDERLKLLDANVERIKKLMDDTKALNDNGFVEKIDLDRVTVTYNNLVVEKDKITRLVALSKALLKYQIGMEQSATLNLTDNLASVKFEAANTLVDKFDYNKRIEYSIFQSQLTSSKLQLKKDYYSYLPSIFAYGTAYTSAMRLKLDVFDHYVPWYPAFIIGAKMTVPIFSGGQRYYRVQQSKVNVLKAENDLKFIQQSIDLDISNTTAMLQNASSTLDTQKKNIELAESVYKTAKIKMEQGVGSSLEVLNAETALKEAQTNYYNALYEALVAKVDFDKATGVLSK